MNDINTINEYGHMIMKNEIKTDLSFQWQDRYLMNTLLKQFDRIYSYSNSPDGLSRDESLSELNRLISNQNDRVITESQFIENMEENINKLIKKYPEIEYRNEYNINYYKKELNFANRLLIYGEGGIGKSYYLYKLSEQLKSKNIPYLCLYSKYTKEIPKVIMKELLDCQKEFYLIIDAFNELSNSEQQEMLKFLIKISNKLNINIIISYRSRNLDDDVENKLKEILPNYYKFEGVEYENSLERLIETYGIELGKYLDIIETNNPLYLKMLYTILDNTAKNKKRRKNKRRFVDNKIGDLVQVTSILETYIRIISGNGNYWEATKKVCSFMFDHGRTDIVYDEIRNLLDEFTDEYINKMMKENLIDFYIYKDEKNYIFQMQYMSDYLIVRSLNNIIEDKKEDEIIEIINQKITKNHSWIEPIAILIFDKYKGTNIEKALNIIVKSKLKDNLNFDIFKKMTFNDEQIEVLQKRLKCSNDSSNMLILGGYHNRPFNCVNYFNNILLSNRSEIKKLSFGYSYSTPLLKLKNALYNMILIKKDNAYVKEMFWYAFWLSSVSNERIRNLSLKLLYDITSKFKNYADELAHLYSKVDDYYLKKSIVHVLTSLSGVSDESIEILNNIYTDKNELDSENIYRISNMLEDKNNYINLTKKNLYSEFDATIKVDEKLDLSHILLMADMYEKYVLKFERYNSENSLKIYEKFILNDKNEITKWNKELNKIFKCINKNGYCKYGHYGITFNEVHPELKTTVYSPEKLFLVYQEIFKKVCSEYNYSYDKEKDRFDEYLNPFSDSLLKKCLLITQDIVLGSLMCNYYIDEISIYNDNKTLGYSVYEPMNLLEEELNICSPISLYCESIDHLNNKIEKRFKLNDVRDEAWYNNVELSINNICSLLIPIDYEGKQWIPISIQIHRFISNDKHQHLYTESYDWTIGIDPIQHLIGDSDSRDLTIDRERYNKNIDLYVQNNFIKSIDIKCIKYDSKDFKNTNLSFPPSAIINELNLKYDNTFSTWKNDRGEIIVYCDNNNSDFYKDAITNAVYIRKDYLDIISKNHQVVYWAYTEKNYLDKGWNEDASLHLELDGNGNVISKYQNNSLKNNKNSFNKNCKKCKYGIYQELSKSHDFPKLSFFDDLDDEELRKIAEL